MGRFVSEVLDRRVPQVLGVYLAAGWALLEFSSWAETRYALQAPAVEVTIAVLAAFLIPTLGIAWRIGAEGARRPRPRAPPRSVAVLPFVAVGGGEQAELFGFGLADRLVTDLARIRDLQVVARSSSFAYDEVPEDVRKLGRVLGARAVLEGCVHLSDQRLRVTTHLVDAENGYHLWSQRFDRTRDDLFAIEDEIAHSVARAMNVVLLEHERRAIGKVPTRHIEALEYYVRGRRFLFQTRRRSLVFAREMFGKAIAVDPEFGLAHAGLADVAALLAMYFPTSGPDLERARRSAERALELDPDQAESHAALGAVLFVSGEISAAEASFRQASKLDPRLFEAYYFHARACFQTGRFDEAADLYRDALRVREDYASAFFLAQSLEAVDRPEEAREAYRDALRVTQRHLDLNPDDARAATMHAVALCRLGRRMEGLEWAERALNLDSEDAGVRYNVACLYAVAGLPERALECLESAVAIGFGNPEWLDRDPDLENLRNLPAFEDLMERTRARDQVG
ncbi:MAG: tetratricopeptide repeat protein [Gemmatimonadetes bacterium]|nr:tetratricopeptide repeat protein [Gemmatimonadota bacterium]MBT8405343.1 tetratricopeptide repeat protein [Gemmatimonadota bacterium]NNF38285.1 tetratricopeptide repeat protein [Gemmatimonadota bacterium]NNK64245.1 tetratricopeptide repeat protein [Gemmatimonadota bacterium]